MNETITVGVTRTVNLGNYESLRINVGMSRTLARNEDRDKAFDSEYDWLDNKLISLIEESVGDM